MSEEKLVPKLRFGGFDEDWVTVTIDDLFDNITDYVAAGSFADIRKNVTYLKNQDYAQLIRTADLKSNFSNGDFVYMDKHAFEYLWRVNLDEPCIILPNIGNIGEVYYVNPNELPYNNNVLAPNAILLKSNNTIKFKYYLLESPYFKNQLDIINEAGGRGKFNKTNLKKIKIKVPNNNLEKEKIGNCLSSVDNKIELLEAKHKSYIGFKKYLMQQIFTQKLRFADYNEYSLKQILEKIENGFSGTQVNYETPFPVTRIETISSGIINYNKVGFVNHIPERYLLKEGDILLTNINSIKWIGNSVYFDGKRVLYHGMNLMLLRSKKEINSKYLYYYITYNNNWFKKMACQAVNQASINKSTLEKFIVKIPDFETQNNIANVLTLTDEKINRISNQVDLTKKFKKGLLQQMFV